MGPLPSKQVASGGGGWVLPVPPIPGWRQLFVGGPTSLLLQDRNQERGTPTAIPWPPLTLDEEICQWWKLCTQGCPGPAVGGAGVGITL